MNAFKVATAQIDIELHDIEANVRKHLEWIKKAHDQDVDLVVFPELSLTGYQIGPEGYRLGMDIGHPVLRQLAEAAGDMRVVVGFVEEGFAAQFFCAAAVLHQGRVEFVHRKLNLPNYGAMEEAKYFAAGRYVETVSLEKHFTGAILLCADMWNPGLVHLAALHGATVLIVPTNSSLDEDSGDFSKPAKWDMALQFYATIYGLPIVFCNRIGREGGHVFWGGSRILDARGEALTSADDSGEVLITAELDYDTVRQARFELPTVRDSNLGLIHREIDRLVSRLGVPEHIRHHDNG